MTMNQEELELINRFEEDLRPTMTMMPTLCENDDPELLAEMKVEYFDSELMPWLVEARGLPDPGHTLETYIVLAQSWHPTDPTGEAEDRYQAFKKGLEEKYRTDKSVQWRNPGGGL